MVVFVRLAPVNLYSLRICGLLAVNYYANSILLKMVWKPVFPLIDSSNFF